MRRCKGVQRLIFDYLDDKLSGAAKKAFEQHMRACPKCKEVLERIKGQEGLLRGVGQLDAPPQLWNLIEERFLAPVRKRRFVLFRLRPALTLAAAVILLGLSLYLAIPSRWPTPGPSITPLVEKGPAASDLVFYLEEHAWLENEGLGSSDALLLAEASVKENGG